MVETMVLLKNIYYNLIKMAVKIAVFFLSTRWYLVSW